MTRNTTLFAAGRPPARDDDAEGFGETAIVLRRCRYCRRDVRDCALDPCEGADSGHMLETEEGR